MLKELVIQNESGMRFTLPLTHGKKYYRVESIEGLGPVKATLVSSDFAQMDGSLFQSGRRDVREIKFTISLIPDYVNETAATLRQTMYYFFLPKSKVRLFFKGHNDKVFTIEGRIESLEPSLFSKETEVDVNVVCFNPDFEADSPSVFMGNTTSTMTPLELFYHGNVSTGFIFRMTPNRALNGFTIYHRSMSNTEMQMDYQGPVKAGDEITINTIVGSKEVMLKDSATGLSYSTLYYLSLSSKWIQLTTSTNAIRVYSDGDPIPYTIEYTPKYGGL